MRTPSYLESLSASVSGDRLALRPNKQNVPLVPPHSLSPLQDAHTPTKGRMHPACLGASRRAIMTRGLVAKGLQTLQLPSNRFRFESLLGDLPRMSLGSRLI
jgi:hypothetical protein